MKISVKSIIKYKVKKNHPDLQYIDKDKRNDEFVFDDTYYIDTDCFDGIEDIVAYIKRDLALVAGGGYDTDTIKDVNYQLDFYNEIGGKLLTIK